MADISYNAFMELVKSLHAQQRYFEAHCNLKKAGEVLLKMYHSAQIGPKKEAFLRELLKNRRLAQQIEMNIDFDRYKTNSEAKILEIIKVPKEECIGECSNIFSKYCDENVLEVIIYESDVCFPTHLRSLGYLLRTLQRLCINLNYFKLKCKRNSHCAELQADLLYKFQKNIYLDWGIHFEYDIVLQRCFDKPKIVFNTGVIFYFEAGFKFFVYAEDPNRDRCRTLERGIDVWQTSIWPN